MERKPVLIYIMQLAYQEVKNLCNQISDREKNTVGTFEHWSAKDNVAHITSWNVHLLQNLVAARRNEPLHEVDNVDLENARFYQENQNKPWSQVLAEMEETHAELLRQVQTFTEEELAAVGDVNGDRPLWRRLAGEGYIHPISHLAGYLTEHSQSQRASQVLEATAANLLPLDDSPAWLGLNIYNQACAYAMAGLKDKAIDRLKEALQLNPELKQWAQQDPDLLPLHDEPGFKSLYRS